MKKVIYTLTYYSLYCVLCLFAFLPFCLLYLLSDFLYIIVYYVVRYRKKVVRTNLENAFPHLSVKEKRGIEKKFYRYFCDYLVETIKLLHISDKQMSERMKFQNVDGLKEVLKEQSCLLFIGHYGNWEWVTSLNLHFKDDVQLGQVYKRLRNDAVNDFFQKLRSRFDSFGVDKNFIFREIIRRKRNEEKILIGFIADQSPSLGNIHYWLPFFNQNTPVFLGVERISKQTGFGVAYLDVQRIKRGFYECEIKLITTTPKDEPEYAITEACFRELEKTIMRAPQYWLWSHKRWKYKNQEEVDKLRN